MADVRKELSFCAKVGVPVLGVVENMSGLSVPVQGSQLTFTSGADGSDVTEQVRAVLATHLPHLMVNGEEGAVALTAHVDVFAASRGGAARMCEQAGVPFLGRVPLDPSIAAAAEQGRSLFADADAGDGEERVMNSPSFAAVKAIVDGVVRGLQEKKLGQTA
jgi:Mrp family chromosome partitioning ATPase